MTPCTTNPPAGCVLGACPVSATCGRIRAHVHAVFYHYSLNAIWYDMIIRIATSTDADDLARMNLAFNGVTDSAGQIVARLVACAEIETAILAELDDQVGGFACVRVV